MLPLKWVYTYQLQQPAVTMVTQGFVPFLFLLSTFMDASLSLLTGVLDLLLPWDLSLIPGRTNNCSLARSHRSQQHHNHSAVTMWIFLHLNAVCTCKSKKRLLANLKQYYKIWSWFPGGRIIVHWRGPILPSNTTTTQLLLCESCCISMLCVPVNQRKDS